MLPRVRAGALLLLVAVGCSVEREAPSSGGVHPQGWADKASPAFHAAWLAANGFPLDRCQSCHGDDYAGGAVGVSCSQASCHSAAPTACTTCHGGQGTPRPATGAHWAHQAFCDTCHQVPAATTASVQQHASGDAGTLVHFGGLALEGGAQPTWDPDTQKCGSSYCHGAASPAWTSGSQIQCDGCHKAPPASHARWARVASGTASCATYHPPPDGGTHVDGQLELTVPSCTTCHGSSDHANPPVSLDGSTDPTARGVGAHERHLDGTLPDRISAPLLCNDCHVVPTAVLQPGHLDQPQTQVRFPFGGSYDSTTATCTVWCHFDRAPRPTWTDSSGAERQCDSCHGFPPQVTRAGAPHPSVAGQLSVCLECHVFGPSTHVNGVVDFKAPGAAAP